MEGEQTWIGKRSDLFAFLAFAGPIAIEGPFASSYEGNEAAMPVPTVQIQELEEVPF